MLAHCRRIIQDRWPCGCGYGSAVTWVQIGTVRTRSGSAVTCSHAGMRTVALYSVSGMARCSESMSISFKLKSAAGATGQHTCTGQQLGNAVINDRRGARSTLPCPCQCSSAAAPLLHLRSPGTSSGKPLHSCCATAVRIHSDATLAAQPAVQEDEVLTRHPVCLWVFIHERQHLP